ncbi:hypothetical protein [Nostocoides australiense]|nr:hypothetical protein [Tetrasphaera australiensis]
MAPTPAGLAGVAGFQRTPSDAAYAHPTEGRNRRALEIAIITADLAAPT